MRQQGKPMNIQQPLEPGDDNTTDALDTLRNSAGIVRTQTSHQVAIHVNKPRQLARLQELVIQEASLAKGDFYYAWTVNDKNANGGKGGKSLIEGVSIEGAMIMIRNWGNCACEPSLVDEQETPTHWVFKATFIDLETGYTSARLLRQRKSERHGKFDAERAMDIAFQIGQSKAIRNTIVRSLPIWLREAGLDAAKRAEAKKYENVREAIGLLVKFAAEHQISEEQLQRKLGKKFADWVPSDIAVMRGVFRAAKDGLTTLTAEFSDDEPAEPKEPKPETGKEASTEDAAPPAQEPAQSSPKPEAKEEPKAEAKPAHNPEEADSPPPDDVDLDEPTVPSDPEPPTAEAPPPAADDPSHPDHPDHIPFGGPEKAEVEAPQSSPKKKKTEPAEPVFTPPTRGRK